MLLRNINSQEMTNYNCCNQPNFKSSKYDELFKVIPDSKVGKDLRPIDINLFKSYVMARPYRMNITPDEIRALEQYDGDDFIIQSYNFLNKKFGVDEEIAPALAPAVLNKNVLMLYNPAYNMILVNTESNNIPKARMFAVMRHEYQHYFQSISILCHEDIGEKALDSYTTNFINTQKLSVQPYLKMSDEEILNSDDINQDLVLRIKKYAEENNQEEIDKIYSDMGQAYRTELSSFRDKLIKKKGLIKSDSFMTPYIQRYFNEFSNVGYFCQDQSIDYSKYLATAIERDALLSESMALAEFKGGCPIKVLRDEFLNNKEETAKVFEELD